MLLHLFRTISRGSQLWRRCIAVSLCNNWGYNCKERSKKKRVQFIVLSIPVKFGSKWMILFDLLCEELNKLSCMMLIKSFMVMLKPLIASSRKSCKHLFSVFLTWIVNLTVFGKKKSAVILSNCFLTYLYVNNTLYNISLSVVSLDYLL